MKFIGITLKYGFFQKKVIFSDMANIVYSKKNSTGKTTFLRAIFYAMGYPIPSTKGLKFDKMEFWLDIENNSKIYKIYRHNSYLSIDDGKFQFDYYLPTDFYEILIKLTGNQNKEILDNLLGAFYLDQEKGWTLLNRGKVIGNISFSIESLARGLGDKDCSDQLQQLDALERQIKKYEYMHSVAKYQNELYEMGEDISYDHPEEVRDIRLETFKVERRSLLEEQKQIKSILRKNRLLADYISDLKLTVLSNNGEEIPVTKDTLVGFDDNLELLATRREMLSEQLSEINRKISSLEKQKIKEGQLLKIETIIESFDSDINKIYVDEIAVQNIIDELKKRRRELKETILDMTNHNNYAINKLQNYISLYAKELGVRDEYIYPYVKNIFSKDLKSLSGTLLHNVVFSFKLAYIKLIREATGIVLPIVLDSPSGREVELSTVEKMLKIIQRDYFDHQLIVASIHDYDLNHKKIIEFNDRLFSETDMIIS